MEKSEKAQGALECANGVSERLNEIFSDEDISPLSAWEEWAGRNAARATLYVRISDAITGSFEAVRDAA